MAVLDWASLLIARYLSFAVLLVTGFLGIRNGLIDWGDGSTPLQHSVNIGVLIYGLLGIVTLVGLILKRRWSMATAIAWGIAITYVPAAAIIGYADGDTPIWSAAIASLLSAAIAAGVVWTARAGQRQEVGLRD